MYNKVAEQIKNISAPIHEKVVSKFNKIDFDQIDVERVWEIIYLIMLAFYVGVNVLTSTMFEIAWPPYFFQTFRSVCVTLVVIRLIIIKDMPKKKFVAMIVISFVFLMSHYMSGYGLPIDLLILVLGAYNVDFRKILKTYIAVWSVLLVITIIGAMTGLAENLVYYQGEGGERVRMALGMNYPTDLAAYVAFLMFAYVCVRDEYITYLEIGVMAVLAVAVYYITDARTDFIIMLMVTIVVMTVKVHIIKFGEHRLLSKIIVFEPFILGALICLITYNYTAQNSLLEYIDTNVLSNRLMLGKQAFEEYGIRMFGQCVIENGYGGSLILTAPYFFIDSSYVSILVKYGAITIMVVLTMNSICIYRMIHKEQVMMLVIVIIVSIQSVMEHHYIQYWYNPFILLFFSKYYNEKKVRKNDKELVINLN